MSLMHARHVALGAEFQKFGDTEVVCTYGQLAIEYASMFRSAGLMEMAHRGVLEVRGKERLEFLNRVLSQELISRSGLALTPGQGRFSFLLSNKGRIEAEVNVLHAAECTWLECDRHLLPRVRELLDRYLFREEVRLSLRDDLGELAILGRQAPALVNQAAGVDTSAWEPLRHQEMRLGEVTASLFSESLTGTPGRFLLCNVSELPGLWDWLVHRFAPANANEPRMLVPMGWAALNSARIEAGWPLFNIDFDSAFLPAETGQQQRGVSFTKGCYPGQEIVARMASREQCARRVVGVRADELPLAGAHILDPQQRQVGVVTSSTHSPRLGNASLCLAVISKPHFNEGAELLVEAEGALRPARVVATPFA